MKSALSILIIVTVILGLLVSGTSCSKSPASVVTKFMDCVMQGNTIGGAGQYVDKAVGETGMEKIVSLGLYEVRGYEIKNVSGSVVSVVITFGSQAGTDLYETWVFRVENEKIVDVY